MKTFWITLVGWLVLVAGINFWVDLPHRWHRVPNLFTRQWTESEVWLTPEDFDETRFRARHISLIPQPDVVIIGSSTALSTDEAPLRPELRFYNASIAGATTSDYLFVWQHLKEAGKIPKRAIVWVDPMFFGEEGAWQRAENRLSSAAVERFLRSHFDGRERIVAWLQAAWQRSAALPAELGQLVNGETTWKTARALWSPSREVAAARYDIVPRTERPEEVTAWTSHGVRMMPAHRLRPLTRSEIREIGERFVNQGNWTITQLLSPRSVPKKLRWLVEDMRAAGVKVLLFQPPIELDAMHLLERREDTRRALAESSRLATKLAEEEGARFCDRLHRQDICQPTDYIDATHMVESCARKLLESCLSADPDWSALLNG